MFRVVLVYIYLFSLFVEAVLKSIAVILEVLAAFFGRFDLSSEPLAIGG
jgi:hypothetical protein